MSPKRRQGDIPAFLRLDERVKSTVIQIAAEHYAASSFKGDAEIMLHQGDTNSQWAEMNKEMMDDTYIPAAARADLWNQREKIKSWIAISTTEIKNKAQRLKPELNIDAQIVELPQGRGRGRPPLEPDVKAERARQAEISRLTDPTRRGRGRPRLSDEEKAERAMRDPNAPVGRPRGRPPGSPNVKTVQGQRMVRVIPHLEAVQTEAARELGQDPETLLKLETLKYMLDHRTITEEQYNQRVGRVIGIEVGITSFGDSLPFTIQHAEDEIETGVQLRSASVPDALPREFKKRRVTEPVQDIIDKYLTVVDTESYTPVIMEEEEQEIEEDLSDPRLYQGIAPSEEDLSDSRLYQ